MKTVFAFYAAARYWPEKEELDAAVREISRDLDPSGECGRALVFDGEREGTDLSGDCLVIVPLSGAVQRRVLEDAAKFPHAVLYAAYIRGNASPGVCGGLLRTNAAPAVMDTWAVLRRTHRNAGIALDREELRKKLRIAEAYRYVKGAKILMIGETEPWVVSNAPDPAVYEERFGLRIVRAAQDELAKLFRETSDRDAEEVRGWFTSRAERIVEPTEEDIRAASRMARALVKLLDAYGAEGAAVACFDLLKTGTNMCLGASYVNDRTDRFVSCEGDMDSAVTMLLMKKLTGTKLWMANPGIQPDGTVNFSHCTAPIRIREETLPTVLRSHHESGIGVSLQVKIPAGTELTLCRISDGCGKISIHRAVSVEGPYETACRTQLCVRLDDFDHWLRTSLGCHQVFAFEDISSELAELGDMFGLVRV